MITFDPREWEARLDSIRWFAAVVDSTSAPSEVVGFEALRVASVVEASDLLASPDWEVVTGDAAGRLTEWLSANCKSDFQQWNEVVREVKALLTSSLIPAARRAVAELPIGAALVDCATWDVLHAVMEEIYADCCPPRFFAHLMAVYESGHVPCSWSGAWPEGVVLYR